MSTTFQSLAEIADQLRALVLRLTLSNGLLRAIFRDRANRLLFLFSIALLSYLALSLFFPLWVLIAGPILWGVPHIFASIRYLHLTASRTDHSEEALARAPVFRLAMNVWGAVTVFRILTDTGILQIPGVSTASELPEVVSMLFAFVGCALYYRRSPRRIALGLLCLTPLVMASWSVPLWTTGALVLLHNVVAFVYWYLAARSRREKSAVVIATVLFLAANILIFSGVLDCLYHWYTPVGSVPAARLEYADLGKLIAPWSSDYVLWFHCVVAYAFGQALHYFIWLKAIPDQHHHSEAPTSFRQSYRLFLDDFGSKLSIRILMICAAAVAAWVFLSLPMARTLYFALAAFHGYLELAGLGLVAAKGRA